MSRSFWLGAGAGMVVTAMAAFFLRLREGDPSLRRAIAGEASHRELQGELAAVREELARARAEAARERMQASGAPQPGLDRRVEREGEPRHEPATPGPASEWERLLASGDLRRAAELLSAAYERGDVTRLALMQVAVEHPELLVAGINAHDLPDAFRAVLIDTLSSLADPLAAVSRLDLAGEPNQSFSARVADFLAQSVERTAAADTRTVAAIEQLLAGNEMVGEKVNLYPVLAQLGALGDERALALLREVDVGVFGSGLRSLLHPPARDERGKPLTGALVYSVQFNKGQWENRPRQLQSGDIVVSIGGERVASAADFSRLVKQHHGLGALEYVEAGILRPTAYVGQFDFTTVQLDPGDLQLLYGVYTVKRP